MNFTDQSRAEYLISSRSSPLITQISHKSVWSHIYPIFTFLIPTILLRQFFKPPNYNSSNPQEVESLNNRIKSWREKIALVSIIFLLCLVMAVMTIGMQKIFCSSNDQLIYGGIKDQYEDGELKESVKARNKRANVPDPVKYTFFNGGVFKCPSSKFHNEITPDLTNLRLPSCKKSIKGKVSNAIRIGDLHLNGNDVSKLNIVRIRDRIYNLGFLKYFNDDETVSETFLKENINRIDLVGDTLVIKDESDLSKNEMSCLKCSLERIFIGRITSKSYGCLLTSIVLYLGTVIIFSLLIIKFLLASLYNFYIKLKMSKSTKSFEQKLSVSDEHPTTSDNKKHKNIVREIPVFKEIDDIFQFSKKLNKNFEKSAKKQVKKNFRGSPTITLITAYSENREGLDITLKSLNEQTYDNQLVWIVCDGLVKGEGGTLTPLEALNLMTDIFYISEPSAYYSIAEADKSVNTALVIAAVYINVRVLIVIKYGNNFERASLSSSSSATNKTVNNKIGNRGKRDSQIILLSFLQKYFYKDRLSPLDTEIYKIFKLFHININTINFLSMVDADTLLHKTAIYNFALAYHSDPDVIGVCGETQISNKNYNLTTMCQVFEYFISHYLNKSFESIFGGVTCLPGCFCSYRVIKRKSIEKDPEINEKSQHSFVPIVCNTQIVNTYSQSKLPSLHYKNLYSLGEDRFLTTLILKTFYKQKLIFIPQAKCYTEVPDSLRVLFSQRRRWINSTVHNLFVLSGVDSLCGTFCCSMQFVAIFDIFGTLVLPAAILFTFLLIIKSILFEPEWIPLIMLALIFGFPALMVFLTNLDVRLFFYLLVYIVSLPMWNFALPLYAFWHFDDFSWGETRKVAVESPSKPLRLDIPTEKINEEKEATESEKEQGIVQTGVKMISYEEVMKVQKRR
ncbi:Chitin synthase 1 [Cucumispora dikerogammari]|nr:Chitin synthase 1 [Cucumispora dikerogammari]